MHSLVRVPMHAAAWPEAPEWIVNSWEKERPLLAWQLAKNANREPTLALTRHLIDEGRVGTGLQIRTAGMNGEGRVDVVVAGKSGTYILFNEGR